MHPATAHSLITRHSEGRTRSTCRQQPQEHSPALAHKGCMHMHMHMRMHMHATPPGIGSLLPCNLRGHSSMGPSIHSTPHMLRRPTHAKTQAHPCLWQQPMTKFLDDKDQPLPSAAADIACAPDRCCATREVSPGPSQWPLLPCACCCMSSRGGTTCCCRCSSRGGGVRATTPRQPGRACACAGLGRKGAKPNRRMLRELLAVLLLLLLQAGGRCKYPR